MESTCDRPEPLPAEGLPSQADKMCTSTEDVHTTASATITIRASREEIERLKALAEATNRSVSFLGHEAIARYLAEQEWQVAAIEETLAKSEAGAETIPHERVVEWLDSWGSEHEQPPPRRRLRGCATRPMTWRAAAVHRARMTLAPRRPRRRA